MEPPAAAASGDADAGAAPPTRLTIVRVKRRRTEAAQETLIVEAAPLKRQRGALAALAGGLSLAEKPALAFAGGAAAVPALPAPAADTPLRRRFRRVETVAVAAAGTRAASESLLQRLLASTARARAPRAEPKPAPSVAPAARAAAAAAASAARFEQVRRRRRAATQPAAAASGAEADPMASLFHMYDLVRSEPGAAAAAAAAAAARAERAKRVAAAAAAARDEEAVLCNYLPLVREALRDAGVSYDEASLDPTSPQNARQRSGAEAADAAAAAADAAADDDEEFVYDVYCLEAEDDAEGFFAEGDDASDPAVTVRVTEPPDGDTSAWFVSEPAGAAGGGWAGGGSSDEDGAEVDYPEDEDSDDARDDASGSSDSDGSGGAAFMRAAAARWRGPAAGSDDDDEDEDEDAGVGGGKRRGRRLHDPYASDDEEYDTVAYDAEEEAAAWAPRR